MTASQKGEHSTGRRPEYPYFLLIFSGYLLDEFTDSVFGPGNLAGGALYGLSAGIKPVGHINPHPLNLII